MELLTAIHQTSCEKENVILKFHLTEDLLLVTDTFTLQSECKFGNQVSSKISQFSSHQAAMFFRPGVCKDNEITLIDDKLH